MHQNHAAVCAYEHSTALFSFDWFFWISVLLLCFNRSFEMDVTFPMESLLKIQIWDYDTLSADDLIGETTIDLEDRYFAPNQARCGIQEKYEM